MTMYRIVTETRELHFEDFDEAWDFTNKYFETFGVLLSIEEVEDAEV